ncbi:MAG: hypothetical protein HY851_12195, partial [candidate division Zixibacteria bacterium]|nr:hypothetical protein [candidate division Zixibacteria bacterium]
MRLVICLLALVAIPAASMSQTADRQALDKITAVVGSEIILASELAGQMQLVALQSGQRPKTDEEMKKFQHDIL